MKRHIAPLLVLIALLAAPIYAQTPQPAAPAADLITRTEAWNAFKKIDGKVNKVRDNLAKTDSVAHLALTKATAPTQTVVKRVPYTGDGAYTLKALGQAAKDWAVANGYKDSSRTVQAQAYIQALMNQSLAATPALTPPATVAPAPAPVQIRGDQLAAINRSFTLLQEDMERMRVRLGAVEATNKVAFGTDEPTTAELAACPEHQVTGAMAAREAGRKNWAKAIKKLEALQASQQQSTAQKKGGAMQ